jgi:hypothetical protein
MIAGKPARLAGIFASCPGDSDSASMRRCFVGKSSSRLHEQRGQGQMDI